MLHSYDALDRDRFGDPDLHMPDPYMGAHVIPAHPMTMLQLTPPIAVGTPDGEGLAHILSDHGQGTELCWTVVMTGSGDIRTYSHGQITGLKTAANTSRMAAM